MDARGCDLDDKVSRQSEQAIAEADVVLFVVDATVGITEEDDRVARVLRGAAPPVLLVANKVDDASREPPGWELMPPGPGRPATR